MADTTYIKKEILTTKAPKPIGAYSQAVAIGPWLFLSGQIPINPQTNTLITGDITTQTKQVMENIKQVLTANKAQFSHIVKSTIFLTNMDDFSKVNTIYNQYFNPPYPARVAIAVKQLPKNAKIEIDAIAYITSHT